MLDSLHAAGGEYNGAFTPNQQLLKVVNIDETVSKLACAIITMVWTISTDECGESSTGTMNEG